MFRKRFAPGSWRRWLTELVLVVLVILGMHLYQTRTTATGPAPALNGLGLQHEPLDLAQLRGRTVLVHFWATWCPVCQAEADNIVAVARDWAVFSVALEDTPRAAVQAYAHQAGFTFPVLQDVDGSLAAAYGVRGVPTSFVVDADGRIRFTEVGYTTTLGLRMRLWLADKLAGLTAPERS